MVTLICNDTIEYIMKAIDFLRKVKHVRPTTEKIYNSMRKELNDKLDIVKYKTNIDYLINNGIVEVRGEGDQESVFIVERTVESSEESGEKPYRKQICRRKYRWHKKKTEIRKLG